jgi:hypothetical protein
MAHLGITSGQRKNVYGVIGTSFEYLRSVEMFVLGINRRTLVGKVEVDDVGMGNDRIKTNKIKTWIIDCTLITHRLNGLHPIKAILPGRIDVECDQFAAAWSSSSYIKFAYPVPVNSERACSDGALRLAPVHAMTGAGAGCI